MAGKLGRKEKTAHVENNPKADLTEKLVCPFCGTDFEIKDLVFAIRTDESEVVPDQIYHNFLRSNFLPTGKILERRMKFIREWDESNVREWEEEKRIPLIVEGKFYAPTSEEQTVGSISSSDLGLTLEEDFAGDMISVTMKMDEGSSGLATYRLCPHCHCELPKGVGIYKEVVVGLYGGKRSGKTTYMAIAATYMEKSLNSLSLGQAMVMEESRDVLNNLYRDASASAGLASTAMGKPSFPIGLTVLPNDNHYKPFFLIFQDIPGEAAVNGDDTLINHPFVKATAFLGVIDVNMFVLTPELVALREADDQLRQLNDELQRLMIHKAKAGEPEDVLAKIDLEYQNLYNKREEISMNRNLVELSICTRQYSDIFGAPKFAEFMSRLRSVQLMLTKLDRWMEASPIQQKELPYCSEIIEDHTNDHSQGINLQHLDFVDAQIRSLIKLFPDANLTDEKGGTILEWVTRCMNMKSGHAAFTAVSSKQNLNNRIDDNPFSYKDSMNILDPILNICRWENLLPTKQA